MKIRWRQHELALVTATLLIAFAGYLFDLYHNGTNQFANPFIETRTPFNFYKNVFFPHIIVGLSSYLAYLWFSLYTIPHLLFPQKREAGMSKISLSFSKISFQGLAQKIAKEYAWAFVQVVLVIFLFGTVLNITTYYMHQWQFNYPGFSIFFNRDNPRSQLNVGGTFFGAATVVFIYALYIIVREIIINRILATKQRAYYISVCNKITTLFLVILTIHIFLQSFNIVHERKFFANYILVTSGLVAMFISNVYSLFPRKGNGPFFRKEIITRLLSTSFIYAAPLIIIINEHGPVAFLYSWALQLFIVTPLTWLYFQYNKDKILQLRVVETQLVKSKADLQFLRSQINPHFLFNILNTLYGTALQENASNTAEGIQKLGDMMRFMLHENNLDFIDMHKEVDYLSNYITLQKLRTQSSPEISIEDNINGQNCNHKIAPMLLIPLVENAFKHGISLKEKSWIKINLHCTEKDILFEVRNSVHQRQDNDPEKDKSGIGFKNVLERLKLIYPGKFQIAVNDDAGEFFVQLSIQP